jgi:hypothetical protein
VWLELYRNLSLRRGAGPDSWADKQHHSLSLFAVPKIERYSIRNQWLRGCPGTSDRTRIRFDKFFRIQAGKTSIFLLSLRLSDLQRI